MKKKPKTTALQRTAYHEAGHAVMYLEENKKFRHVTIVPDDKRGSLGHILGKRRRNFDPESGDERRIRRILEAEILCTLAGPVAEAIFTGRKNWGGAASDLSSMTSYALYCVGNAEEASAFVKWLWIRAQNTMKARWPLVVVVAEALLERNTLSYNDTREAIRIGLTKNIKAWRS